MAGKGVVIPILADVKGLTSGIGDTEKQLSRLGKNVGQVGKNLTKNLTLPIVALGAGAVAAFVEVDKGLDAVAVGTGATGEALKDLQQNFKNVAANATQGMEEVGNVVAEVNTRLGLTGAPLEEFSERMLTLSRVTGMDAVAATKSITRAMNDAGVAVEDAGGFMDILLVASQQTGIGVDTLADSLVKFGSPMRQLGFSVEETAALLGGFEKAGVNTDLVMGSLRIGLGKLAKAGEKDLPKALRESIKAIQDAETGGEAAAMAMELFGTRAGADMAAAIREGRLDVEDLVSTLENAEGALDATADATEGPQEKIAMLKNQVMLLGASFADIFLPVLEKAIPVVQNLVKRFDGMSDSTKRIVIIFGAALAAIGPVLIIIGKMIAIVGTAIKIIKAMKIAFAALNIVMSANPIALVVIAIAALIAGLILAYKKSETFRNIVDKLGATVRDVVAVAFTWLREKIQEIWPSIQEAYDRAKPILELIGKAVELYVTTYIKAVVTIVKTYYRIFKEAYDLLLPVFKLIGEGVKKYIVANVQAIKTAVNAGRAAFDLVYDTIVAVKDKIGKPLDKIDDKIRTSIGGAVKYVSGLIGGITTLWRATVTTIKDVWNRTLGGRGFTLPGWLGGNSFTIPKLAKGGIVTSPTIAMIGEAGPEAVVPLDRLAAQPARGGGDIYLTINAGLGTNPDELSRVIVDSIKRYERRNGQVFSGPLVQSTTTAAGVASTASGATDFNFIKASRRG